jgi:hypothetical protein
MCSCRIWTSVSQLREHFLFFHDRSHACPPFQDTYSVPLWFTNKATANVSFDSTEITAERIRSGVNMFEEVLCSN